MAAKVGHKCYVSISCVLHFCYMAVCEPGYSFLFQRIIVSFSNKVICGMLTFCVHDVKSCEKGMPFLFLLPEIIYFCKLIE